MNRKFFAVICTLAFSLFLSQTVRACSCSEQDVKSLFSSSAAVFIGKVSENTIVKKASVGYVLPDDSDRKSRADKPWKISLEDVQKVTLDVVEPFKGVTQKTFVLSAWSGNCGVPFSVGGDYLVFAYQDKPLLSESETARPKEKWTPETRLKAEADKLNEQVPLYFTNDCLRTGRPEFMKDELIEIRSFLKDGKWKASDKVSPILPSN